MALPPTTGAPLNLYIPPFNYGVNPGDDPYSTPENDNTVAINAFAATVVLYSPTASQTVVQPTSTFFNFNSPIVYGAPPSLLFGTAANTWDSALTRTAEGAFTLDSNSAGNAAATLKLNILNAVTGFQYNGAAPLNHILVGDGTNYVDSAALPAGLVFYQFVQQAGASVTQRDKLNFLAPLTAIDDAGNLSSDVGLAASGVTAGTYSAATLTVSAEGLVTAASGGYAGTIAVTGGIIPANSSAVDSYTIGYTVTPGQVVAWNVSTSAVGSVGVTVYVYAIGSTLYVALSNPANATATVPNFDVYYKII